MRSEKENKANQNDDFWDDFWRSKKRHAYSEIIMYGIMIIGILLGILILS